MSTLRGATALVTGASRGIGAAIVERLCEEGARVWAGARSAAALRELGGRTGAEPLVVDVTDADGTWAALDGLQDVLGGPPHIVVNAAGAFHTAPCAQESVRGFDEMMAVNLRGAFLTTRALLPGMMARGSGLMVQVGSVAGRRAFPGNGAYAASKFGLRGFHEVLLEEIRGSGVRATLLEPAATDTPLWDPLDPDSDPTLPDRADMLRPEDVAEAVLFVATRPPHVRIPLLQIEHA